MKILVTGYKGFIGQNLVNSLKDHDLLLYEWNESFPDIRNVDWVIHAGAISSTTETNVEKIMAQNYDFSVFLFERCAKYNVNLQYSSSASVYGKSTTFRESDSPSPLNVYAWSKSLFDTYVLSNIDKCKNVVQGFRYFNVYGPHEDHKGDQASPFYKFSKQFKETGQIKVFENSQNYKRDFVHVSEVVDTHIKFFNVKESGIWNVGTGTATSFLDVAKTITQNIVEIPFPENIRRHYQEYTCANLDKMNSTLKKYNLSR